MSTNSSSKRAPSGQRASADRRSTESDAPRARKASSRPHSHEAPSSRRSKAVSARPDASAPGTDWPHAVLQFMRNLFARQVGLSGKDGHAPAALREPPASRPGKPPVHSAPMPLPSSGEAKPSHATLLGISSSQLKRMRHQLSAVLDLHPATRSVFPHLNYLDKALRRQGADCFRDLPVEVLHKALKQLDSLVQSAHPGPVGLAELRACLVVSAVDRGGPDVDGADAAVHSGESSGLPSHLSDFNLSSKLSVNEVSASDFEHANQQWVVVDDVVTLTKS